MHTQVTLHVRGSRHASICCYNCGGIVHNGALFAHPPHGDECGLGAKDSNMRHLGGGGGGGRLKGNTILLLPLNKREKETKAKMVVVVGKGGPGEFPNTGSARGSYSPLHRFSLSHCLSLYASAQSEARSIGYASRVHLLQTSPWWLVAAGRQAGMRERNSVRGKGRARGEG